MKVGELKILSGRANPNLAKAICKCISTDLGKMTVQTFPDMEVFVRIDENVRGRDVFLIQPTSPPANDHLMELLLMIDAARRASAQRITAVMPFYGYARQDRKDQPRVPITAKLIANLLVAAGADRILTLDLHAQQIQGFFDIPVDHLYASPVFYDHLKTFDTRNMMIFAPDIGGVKMAAAYADMMNCGLGFVAKRRTDAETVQALNFVGEVKDKEILLIDDMTETAGTLTAAAQLLKDNGAKKVIAAVTHGVLNEKGYSRLKENALDELITTNSTTVQRRELPLTILNVASLLAQGILCIHRHESISSLFKIKGY